MRVIVKRFISLAVCFAFVAAETAQAHAYAAGPSGFTPSAAAGPAAKQALPSDPSRLHLPVTHASVRSLHPGRSGVTIFHIQDAHSNLSGQRSLAAALDEIMTRYPVELVLVEGGSGDVTLDRLKSVGTREQWDRAAGRLLYEGLIAGEEYLNLTSAHPMRLEGIEQDALYRQSLRVYDAIVRHRRNTLPYLRRISIALDRVKNRLYPQTLLDYESSGTLSARSDAGGAGDPGSADLMDRAEKLIALAGDAGVDPGSFASVRELMLLKTAEKRIDFTKAGAEEEALWAAAFRDRSGPDFEAYMEARRTARSSPVAQLALLNDLLERSGRGRGSLFMLGAYLKYLEDFSRLDMTLLLTELELLEDTVYREILKESEDARMLRVCDRFVGLLGKAYRIRMSSDEFRMLKVNEGDLPTPLILGFLNRQLAELGYDEDLTPYETPLEDARYAIEMFYRLVEKRDRAFIRNAKAALTAAGAEAAVLITGGYHTAHLEKLMRAEDWSYAVLTPVVEYETDQIRYEQRLLAPLKSAGGRPAAGSQRGAGQDFKGEKGEGAGPGPARGAGKARDGLRAQAAAARLAGVPDPEMTRVIRGVLGASAAVDGIFGSGPAASGLAPEASGARMTSDIAARQVRADRPANIRLRRILVLAQNWFFRNASLAITASMLSLVTSYLMPRTLFWMTAGFLTLSLTSAVFLARRYHQLGKAQMLSELNVVFQSLMVASVMYAGMGWKNGVDEAARRFREIFLNKARPVAVPAAPDVVTLPAPDLTAPFVTAPDVSVPAAREAVPADVSAALPERVLAGMNRASGFTLPVRVQKTTASLGPLFGELLSSESALLGYPAGSVLRSDSAERIEFEKTLRRTAVTMIATSIIETGKGNGGVDTVDVVENNGKGRAAGVWQMNGATAKWIITNLISQPEVYLKKFIEASPDPERMRAGIMNLRAAYAGSLFDMFNVDPAEGEGGWKKVAEAAAALSDDAMRDLLAKGDPGNERLDRSDLYRVQFVTARFLMLFKRVEDAESYMRSYNTSIQADPSFKGLTTWAKSETIWVQARLLVDSIFEAYDSGADPDMEKLDRLESRLELLMKASDGFGGILVDMTNLLKISIKEPASAQAPVLIGKIREDLLRFQVQFGSVGSWGLDTLVDQLAQSVKKDLGIIEARLMKAGVNVSRADLPADLVARMDQALIGMGGSSTAGSQAYSASRDGRHEFVVHEELAALARDWMAGKWGDVPLAALAELTPRDTEAITEPGFTPLLSWMVLSELNKRADQFPGQPFRMHWVDPQAHYGQAKEFYDSVLGTFKALYPDRAYPAPGSVTRAADAAFIEFHTNAEGEDRPMTIFGGEAGQMLALNAEASVPWRHLFLTKKVGGAFAEVTSLKRGMLVDPAAFRELVNEVALMFDQQGIGKDGRPVPIQLFIHRATSANGTSSAQLPGIRVASASKKTSKSSGARMAWERQLLSRNALYAPGSEVWTVFYEDQAEYMAELSKSDRRKYLEVRADVIREVSETFVRARSEFRSDDPRMNRLADRAFTRLQNAFLESMPDGSGEPQDEVVVSAEEILADEMSGWEEPTPRELLEGSRILYRIMSGLDGSYFYASPWFQTRLVRSIPPEESRWMRRADRAADWLRSIYRRLSLSGVSERRVLQRDLRIAVQELEAAATGYPDLEKALRASGLLMLTGPHAAAARRAMASEEYPQALSVLLRSARPTAAQMRAIRRVADALSRVNSVRMTSARAPMRRMHLDDDRASELEQIQQDVDRLSYRAPVSKHHPGTLEYRSAGGDTTGLRHLGSGVFNDVFDWNSDYIVRISRFEKAEDQFEDPELIRGAVAGVEGSGLTPEVAFFGQLKDGRSIQIIQKMDETLNEFLAQRSAGDDPGMIRQVVNALERFALRAIETGYSLDDAHTGNFMLSRRGTRPEVVYSDIDGLQKIGASPGSQFQVALHFRGQLLGYPSINPWARGAQVLGRPLLRRLNLMIGAYQADRLRDRIASHAAAAGILNEQLAELNAIQEAIGAPPARSSGSYEWERSYMRYQPRASQDPAVTVPATPDQIREQYEEMTQRVNDFYQKWPRTAGTRRVAELLVLRAKWARAMKLTYHQYENEWARTSLDKLIESYMNRTDLRSGGIFRMLADIGWKRWTLAAASESALALLTWLALGRWEGIGRLIQEHPYLSAAAGGSTALALSAVFMLTARPHRPGSAVITGARMSVGDLWARFVSFWTVPSRLRREASVIRDAENVKGRFQDHESDPAKVWSWINRQGRRVYLKWTAPVRREPSAGMSGDDHLNDVHIMLDRERQILRKIFTDQGYEKARRYFPELLHEGTISASEAAALRRSGEGGLQAPEGSAFILTGEIPGENLGSWALKAGTEAEVVRVMRAVASAVRSVHEAGIFHGDLGPSEVFVSELADGRTEVRFSDLGLAILRGDREHGLTDMLSRRNLLELVNLEFNQDGAAWVGQQQDPWRVRDLASLTNLYRHLILSVTGLEVDKRETARWMVTLLDEQGSGDYELALEEYLNALDRAEPSGARMADQPVWRLPGLIRERIAGLPAPSFDRDNNITQSMRHPGMLLALHDRVRASGALDVMVIGPGAVGGRSPMMEEVLLMMGARDAHRYIVIDPNPDVLGVAAQPGFEAANYRAMFEVPESALPEDHAFLMSVMKKNLPTVRTAKDRITIEGIAADAAAVSDFGREQLDLVIAPYALGYALRSLVKRARTANVATERAEVARWLVSLIRSLRIGGQIIIMPADLEVIAGSEVAEIFAMVRNDLAVMGRELVVDTDQPDLIVLSVEELAAGARMSWSTSPDDPRVLVTAPFYFADHRVVSPVEGGGIYDGIWRRVFGAQDHVQEAIAVRVLDSGDIRIALPAEGQQVTHQDLGRALGDTAGSQAAPDVHTAYILLDRLNGDPVATVQHATEVTAALSLSGMTLEEWRSGIASLSMAVHVIEKIAAAGDHDLSDLRIESTLLSLFDGAPISLRGLTDISRVEKLLFTASQSSRYASDNLSNDTIRSMFTARTEQDVIWAAGYGLARGVGTAASAFRTELDRPEEPIFREDTGYSKALAAARFFLAKRRILESVRSAETSGAAPGAGASDLKKQLHRLLGADLRKLVSGNYMDEEYAFRAALAVRTADTVGLTGLADELRSALRSIDRVLEGGPDSGLEQLFDGYRMRPDISERERPHAEIAVHDFMPDIQTWHQRPQLALTDFGIRLKSLGVKVWIRDDFSDGQIFYDGGHSARLDRLGDVSRLSLRKGLRARLKIKAVERNIPGLSSVRVVDVVRQLMIGAEPVEHPVLGALPAGFLTSGREISAVNLPDDRDGRQLELMDWGPYLTVIDRISALATPEPAPSATRLSEALADSAPIPSVIRLSDFYELVAVLESEGPAWIAQPIPIRPDRTTAQAASGDIRASKASDTADLWTGPAVMQVIMAFKSMRLNGRAPTFATVLSSGADSDEYRARAERTAAMLAAVLDLDPDSYPVITEAEASDPKYASMRKVHLALDHEIGGDAVLRTAVLGRGLNIVSDQDPDSVSMAMVFQALLSDAAGEKADARKMSLLAERHGRFMQGIFGRALSDGELSRALSGMFMVENSDQIRMIRSLPVTGKTLGARLAEAMRSVIEAGRSA